MALLAAAAEAVAATTEAVGVAVSVGRTPLAAGTCTILGIRVSAKDCVGQAPWVGTSTHRAGIVTLSPVSRSNRHSIVWSMSTKDQLLYSALHGTAMRYAAERRNLDESIEELRQIADGRNDILAEAAGITAGSWYAWPSTHVGYELIGAAMLILAGGGNGVPLNYGELERWTRVGYERGARSRKGER
jgi:hypothetical protein